MSATLGIDLGTSSVKVALLGADGSVLAAAHHPVALRRPGPGQAEQDPWDYLVAAEAGITDALAEAGVGRHDIAAIGIDGQMGGALAVDASLTPLTPWYPSALDLRYRPYQARLDARAPRRLVVELSGADPILAPWILRWADHLPAWSDVRKVTLLGSWLAAQWGGATADEVTIDASYLTWTGLADTRRRQWSDELVRAVGITPEMLPRIEPSDAIVGRLTKEAADRCGLAEGTPIINGTGDQVAGFIGAGCTRAGHAIDVTGTFAVFAVAVDRYLPDPDVGMLRPIAGPGALWYAMTFIAGGGLTWAWLDEHLAGSNDERDLLAVPPGCDGVTALPHFLGRGCPDEPEQRGAFVGVSWHHGAAHLRRAILEAFGYEQALALQRIREIAPELQVAAVTAIGGSKTGTASHRIKASITGYPYRHAPGDAGFAAARGAAVLAALGVGVIPSLDTMAPAAPIAEAEVPVAAWRDPYRRGLERYQATMEALRPVFRTASTESTDPVP